MTNKIRISKFGILIIALAIIVYTIWFVFCQDIIHYILDHAISTAGDAERDPISGWIGVFIIPFLIVCVILGVIGLIYYLIEKIKQKKTTRILNFQ